MTLRTNDEYLGLGRQILPLLGLSLVGPLAAALGELARGQDRPVDEARLGAEVFLLHKYLLMQACVGVFPEAHVDHIIRGLFTALNERACGLELTPERQQAMEEMWRIRAEQFDRFFVRDQQVFLDEQAEPIHWKETISQFCRNVRDNGDDQDIWAENNGPSRSASQSVTAVLDEMILGLEEINRGHFSDAV
ncbi:MAG: hypothetical protein AB7P24_10790 [Nitrospira sp.]